MQSKKCPSVKYPSKDIVESGKDDVGYDLNNSYQTAMGAEQNKTEDSGMSNNHILGYENGGNGKLNWMPHGAQKLLAHVVSFLVLYSLILSLFWRAAKNGLVVVLDFYEKPPESGEWIKRFGLQFCHRLKSL